MLRGSQSMLHVLRASPHGGSAAQHPAVIDQGLAWLRRLYTLPQRLSLGTRLTVYLLLGVLVVMGCGLCLSVTRLQSTMLQDVRREVAAISSTLHMALAITGADAPEQYFAAFASRLSSLENVLGLVFYDRSGQPTLSSDTLIDHPLPAVDVQQVIATQQPLDGLITVRNVPRYYRIEPIVNRADEAIAALLVLEDRPSFVRAFRERVSDVLLTTLGLLVVLSSIVAVVIRRSVTQPLQTLSRQVAAIGTGRAQKRLSTTRQDEIGSLAQEFNRMCTRLDDAYQTIAAEGDAKLRLERSLRHSEKLAALGRMASRLAHEMGTPLNVIQGRAEQLLQRRTLEDKERDFLAVIVAQIERISGFIRQLLTVARRTEPHLRRFDLHDLVRRTWHLVSGQGTAPGVTMRLELAENLPPLYGDAEQLQQVFLNLSVNALQAVGSVGQVTLRTRRLPHGPLSPTGQVEIEVEDTGPGIAAQDLPHIFEPFFTTKGASGGTGLGLAISREIVQSHHGDMRVESTPGHGSRFIVSLPLAEASHVVPPGVVGPPATAGRREEYGL